MNPEELVISRLSGVQETASGWTAKCPFHDDRKASLSISVADEGQVLLHCHAGCDFKAIVDALELQPSDLYPNDGARSERRTSSKSTDNRRWNIADEAVRAMERSHGACSHRWTYVDDAGDPVGIVLRWERSDKKLIQPLSRRDGTWQNRAMMDPRPLYDLPAITGASVVLVVEGEKTADALRALSFVVTTSAGGANAAAKTDWTPLRGCGVVILPDANRAGRNYAEDVGRILIELNPPTWIKVVELPGLQPDSGDDAVEFMAERRAAGLTDAAIRNEIEQLVATAPDWTPCAEVSSDSAPWEAPEPLGQFDLPSFPIDLLQNELSPKCPLWPMSAAIAESYQVPVDMPAMLSLAVARATLATRIEVRIDGEWWEPVNLFALIVMEPGERKSGVFREISEPLMSFERDECKQLAPDIERNRTERRILTAAVKHAEQKAAKQTDAEKRTKAYGEAQTLAEELHTKPRLVPPRLSADDATPEAPTTLLHEQDGRIAILSPEGGVFEQMAGRYASNSMPNLDVYLKGHAGDDIRIDRISRAAEFVRMPALTVGLAVQPEVLRSLTHKPGLLGRGVLARFLFSLPSSKVGYRVLHPVAIPEAIKQAYDRSIRKCLERNASCDANGSTTPRKIRPDRHALAVLDQFRSDVDQSMQDAGELTGIRDWALKLPGAVVRIAGILHGLEHAADDNADKIPMNGKTMAAAVAIGRYLIEHAKAAFFEMGADRSIGLARCLLGWMRKKKLQTFTRRSAYRCVRYQVAKVDEVDAPLTLLSSHGYIRALPEMRKGPGRAPSPTFETNPAILGQKGHKGQNRPVEVNCGHSVLSVPRFEPQNGDLGPIGADHAFPQQTDSDGGEDAPVAVPSPEVDDELSADVSAANAILAEPSLDIVPDHSERQP